MSNLPGKITDPHLSAEEPLTFRPCLRFILQALLLAFGCGVGVCMLLLALAALLLTRTNLPLSAVRPMACMAASIGVAVSGFVLARRLKEKLLLCGLGCGAFYTVCLLAATLLAGGMPDWQGGNAMLPLALMLGGLLGGAAAALQEGR